WNSCEVSLFVCVFFFFFQAEDGIRDYKVTGVQTCALPISPGLQQPLQQALISAPHLLEHPVDQPYEAPALLFGAEEARAHHRRRSEERRVGKECRSRWSTDH